MMIRSVFQEEICDQIRMVDLVDIAVQRLEVDEVAEFPRILQQEICGVLAEWLARKQASTDRRSCRQTRLASSTNVRRKGHSSDRTRRGGA